MTGPKFVEIDEAALRAYSNGTMSARDIRATFDADFADILVGLGKYDLLLPMVSHIGREEELARAREWLFPRG